MQLQVPGEVRPAAPALPSPGKARMERDLTEACGGEALRGCLNQRQVQRSRAGIEARGWCGMAGSR